MNFGSSIQNMLILLNALKPSGMKSVIETCIYTVPPDQDQTGVNSRNYIKKQETLGFDELGQRKQVTSYRSH